MLVSPDVDERIRTPAELVVRRDVENDAKKFGLFCGVFCCWWRQYTMPRAKQRIANIPTPIPIKRAVWVDIPFEDGVVNERQWPSWQLSVTTRIRVLIWIWNNKDIYEDNRWIWYDLLGHSISFLFICLENSCFVFH